MGRPLTSCEAATWLRDHWNRMEPAVRGPSGRRTRRGRNVLELDVTNLAANRIRDMDRRGVPWKVRRALNIVNIRYQPFDASKWPPEPSGLLGPVRLVPCKVRQ